MKKYLVAVILSAALLSGCQGAVREYGGSVTLKLDPGQKLEEITWKEDSLWYLTRPMREGEKAETHTFQQSSEWGVFEGTVTVIESDKKMRKKIKFYKLVLAEICETLCTLCIDRSTDKFASGGRYREVYRNHFEKLKEFSRILRQ